MTDHNPLHHIEGLFLGDSDRRLADAVPAHLRDGIARYVEHGILPGGFLRTVISNQLFQALRQADDDMTRSDIHAIAQWLWQCAPGACFGSEEKMRAWADQGGMRRVAA